MSVIPVSETLLSTAPSPLTTVILLVEVMSELFAVVGATHQVPLAAGMTIVLATVTRPVTVALTLVTRRLGRAASLAVIVPTPAPLARRRSQGNPGVADSQRLGHLNDSGGIIAAIVL